MVIIIWYIIILLNIFYLKDSAIEKAKIYPFWKGPGLYLQYFLKFNLCFKR